MAIKTVGVVGCGLMGSGIAQVCAEAGYGVVVREVDEAALKKGLGKIESFLAKGVERGKVTPERRKEVLARLTGTTDLAKLSGCDFVIEVVVESLDAKREVYQALDAACPPATMRCTTAVGTLPSGIPRSASAMIGRPPKIGRAHV